MYVCECGFGFVGEGYLGIENWFVGGRVGGLGYWCSFHSIDSAALPSLLFCVYRLSCRPFAFLPVGRLFVC